MLNYYSNNDYGNGRPDPTKYDTDSDANTTTVTTGTQVVAASKLQGLTSGQANAVRKAKSYLSFTAFSLSGLIGQMEFDGFTPTQARYGANRAL